MTRSQTTAAVPAAAEAAKASAQISLDIGQRARHPRGATLRALTPIVRRLHLQEIPRLRREATRLAAENERLRDRVHHAEACAESWHDDWLRAVEEYDLQIGLTRDGQLLIAPAEVSHG